MNFVPRTKSYFNQQSQGLKTSQKISQNYDELLSKTKLDFLLREIFLTSHLPDLSHLVR
jgi:hypothetical protein